MAAHDKICQASAICPFQSGSDRILKAMNRRYTAQEYLDLVQYAKSVMPGLVLTSDVIVGFPGETDEDFEKTLELVNAVEYDALFTFLFSPRRGTPAASLPDPMPKEDKQRNFDRLVARQNEISAALRRADVGKVLRCPDRRSRRGLPHPPAPRVAAWCAWWETTASSVSSAPSPSPTRPPGRFPAHASDFLGN